MTGLCLLAKGDAMKRGDAGDDKPAKERNREAIDPRRGDIEDDAASPEQRTLLSMAGSLLVEVSLPKLLFAWTVSLLLPAVSLGLAALAASAWLSTLSDKVLVLTEIGAFLVAIGIVALGWIGWKPLFRVAEVNFWSLNALTIQPGYVFGREGLQHLTEKVLGRHLTVHGRARLRAVNSAAAGIAISICAVAVATWAWPASRWTGSLEDLGVPHRLIIPTLANAAVLICGYLAGASLVWGLADARMAQPVDLVAFDTAPSHARIWRVAHLSDLHVVGERYGFRIESGRAGARGNERLQQVMARLAAIHAVDPLDHVLISGDMTDAGRATEWAEFLDILSRYPDLVARMFVLPGNHDINIVDRANPARLDLPFSPGKRLRQVRTLSAIAAIQGDRAFVVKDGKGHTATLTDALVPYRRQMADFADLGGLQRAARLRGVFDDLYPMVVPPLEENGLGIALLNSNAETHFSFTNALGLVSIEQTRRLEAFIAQFPKARWIIGLHHHLMEYPMPVTAFAERIGTAVINGSWFVRRLEAFADRAVVMHGHRHIDWIGTFGSLKVISAPSPIMAAADAASTHFY
ncbi:metallophosphoesterase family protein, partial [Tardiphaga sp. P5_C10]